MVTLCASFKPYYKWITLNTKYIGADRKEYIFRFKPYYKWITLNTIREMGYNGVSYEVLNLIING